MVEIQKIKLKNLKEFVRSESFKSFTDKPISLSRVASYLENPNANKEDYVLYMAFVNQKMIAYRSILTDTFRYNKNKVTFGWLSGNWVTKNYRRKGISSELFQVILNDWNGKLMYTNYAEASKALYDKSEQFEVLKTLKGYRFYRRMCMAHILPNKSSFYKTIKPLLSLFDWLTNLFLDLRLHKKQDINHQKYSVSKIENWSDEIIKFLKPYKSKELFQRDSNTYKWIQKQPWIHTNNDTKAQSKNYHFSSYAKYYDSNFYQISDSKTQHIIAVINISIRDQHLKIPYLYFDKLHVDIIADFVFQQCEKYQINYVTSYNSDLNTCLLKGKQPFLKYKKFEQNYFATKPIFEAFPEIRNLEVQTGDGDGVFT
jgi:hypothetical protein